MPLVRSMVPVTPYDVDNADEDLVTCHCRNAPSAPFTSSMTSVAPAASAKPFVARTQV